MTEYEEKRKGYLALVETALSDCFCGREIPTLLLDSMKYSLLPGGKRLRACMCLATAEMLGERPENALPFACAVEMIHTYSLIHDDLPCMDNDDFRRGKPSNHKVYGEANALLAGDGLLSLAFEHMLDGARTTPCDRLAYINAMSAVAAGAGVSGMVAGQSEDLRHEDDEEAGYDVLREIDRLKTGALITAAVMSGAHIAGADEEKLRAVKRFGECYGLLFQITDDILDVSGDQSVVGKTLGKDEQQGKLTYPYLFGIDRARELARETADEAKNILACFGKKAYYLKALVETTVDREK